VASGHDTGHLAEIVDFVAAALLAASPFLFGFANRPLNVWLPHLLVGIVVILVVLVSRTHPKTMVTRTA